MKHQKSKGPKLKKFLSDVSNKMKNIPIFSVKRGGNWPDILRAVFAALKKIT